MTSGVLNGNNLLVYIGGVAIGCITDCEFTSTNTEIEAICKGYRGTLSGSNTWSVSCNGLWRFDAGYGPKDLLNAHKNDDTVTILFGTDETGDTVITGDVKIPEFTWAGPLDAASTFSVRMAGQGEYTVTTNA